ncbi:MAG: hypothetical protein LBJ04_10975 [Sphingobacterium sp.]|jgi:hypothetical protein|uniref:hypothetical protein n=1 Tax=Sphingobacterium sp. TaxID=341027 RepID=UPI0028330428|nr:hypothetical protein [Sphingobacterium sp.]MDR0263737.1 hypothetical protein [Sphingobacterium sp.]
MKRKFIEIAMFSMCLLSCAKDDVKFQMDNPMNNFTNENVAKEKFAIILSKAVSSNQSMRNFIQEEALKMVDNDYDVFYPFIKDEILDNNLSFRDNLLKVTDQETLSRIESQLPLLTIYVPTLPSGFSPETWSSKDEIPAVVAEGNYKNNELEFFENGEEKIKIKANQIPGFPTLVVKNNERIMVKNHALFANVVGGTNLKSNYQFISSEFHNKEGGDRALKATSKQDLAISKKAGSNSLAGITWGERKTSLELDLRQVWDGGLVDATAAFSFLPGDQWQRDFIYYGLTPTETQGKFRGGRHKEFIHYLSISESGFNLMTNTNSDPDDPILTRTKVGSTNFWSDGYFELRFDVISNAKDGIGERFTDIKSIKPQDLFDIEYAVVGKSIYDIKKIVPKFAKVDIPLQEWDLENLSYGWKISVSELDQASTSTVSTTNTSKFAMNFGLDKTKIGLKFGASAEIGSSKTHTYTVQNATDELGDVLVYFGDKIILEDGMNASFIFNTVYNSNISLLVAPKKIN